MDLYDTAEDEPAPAVTLLLLAVPAAAIYGAATGVAAGLMIGRWLAAAFGYGWERQHRDELGAERRTA